jgi:membrane protein
VEQKFKFITPGSIGGVVIWLFASWGFSAYVANFGKYDETYGSLGGVIVLLLWMWISSVVLLLGAEANALIEHASAEGKDPGEKEQEGAGEKGAPSRRRVGADRGRQEREHERVPSAAAAYVAARTAPGARGAPAYRARPPDPRRNHSRLGVLLAGIAAGLYLNPRRA